ncbi:TAP-like protein-domain-containing protein [Phaeosphaeria sp. MPI-PUGE-AT-0046c]|nr:TAP-like protein-domain-containing protein [Phaeosphaeria sp. MPI-PUGE-AT-0046c]
MLNTASLAGLLASAVSAHPAAGSPSKLHQRDTNSTANITSFLDVPRSSELKWVPCYEGYQCANLEVPLDYENPALGSTVVPWIRHVAVNGTGTDLLFNPGGPGGSGIEFILKGRGNQIMELTGSKYNIVSFDPRGVNASDIHLTCFPEDPKSREPISVDPNLNQKELYAQVNAVNKYCSAVNRNTTARFAGTVAVVQDIMHFTGLQAALNGDKKPEESLVWFFGASYGTVIGQTLAALYPSRIGRVINAANVNSEDHYAGLIKHAVSDADKSMRYFFQLCSDAGEKKCAFAANSSNAKDLETRFDDLLKRLEDEPAQYFNPALGAPGIITRRAVLSIIHDSLYTPTARFPLMARGLAGLHKGNATAWLEVLLEAKVENEVGPFNYTSAAQQAVLQFVTGVDAAGRYEIHNVSDYLSVVEQYKSSSKWFGENYATSNALINAGASIVPPKSQLFAGFQKTKTKNPILFLNTNADPITPLASAHRMASFFEGSGVLAQNSGGHSLLDVKSACTYKHVQTYLDTGKVPDEGTLCETEKKPLVDAVEKRDVVDFGGMRW